MTGVDSSSGTAVLCCVLTHLSAVLPCRNGCGRDAPPPPPSCRIMYFSRILKKTRENHTSILIGAVGRVGVLVFFRILLKYTFKKKFPVKHLHELFFFGYSNPLERLPSTTLPSFSARRRPWNARSAHYDYASEAPFSSF